MNDGIWADCKCGEIVEYHVSEIESEEIRENCPQCGRKLNYRWGDIPFIARLINPDGQVIHGQFNASFDPSAKAVAAKRFPECRVVTVYPKWTHYRLHWGEEKTGEAIICDDCGMKAQECEREVVCGSCDYDHVYFRYWPDYKPECEVCGCSLRGGYIKTGAQEDRN